MLNERDARNSRSWRFTLHSSFCIHHSAFGFPGDPRWIPPLLHFIMPIAWRSTNKRPQNREIPMTAAKWVGLVVIVLGFGGLVFSRAMAATPKEDKPKVELKV